MELSDFNKIFSVYEWIKFVMNELFYKRNVHFFRMIWFLLCALLFNR